MISPHMVWQPIYIIYGSFMHHGSGRRLLGVVFWYHDIPECLRSISYLVNIILASILASGVEESIVNSDICEFWMMASCVLQVFSVLGPSNPVEFHHLVNFLRAPPPAWCPTQAPFQQVIGQVLLPPAPGEGWSNLHQHVPKSFEIPSRSKLLNIPFACIPFEWKIVSLINVYSRYH